MECNEPENTRGSKDDEGKEECLTDGRRVVDSPAASELRGDVLDLGYRGLGPADEGRFRVSEGQGDGGREDQ
jgi:hypothetical protein